MNIPIERWILANGAVLLVSQRKESPSVIVAGSMPAGAFLEEEPRAGLADFTARLLMRGTAERDHQQIARELENVGASIGFGSSAEALSFNGKSLPQHLDLVLRNIADCLRSAAFPTEEVEKVRGMMITGLKQWQDDTRARAEDALRESVYPVGHPYRRNGRPTEESLQAISQSEIAAFRDRNFSSRGMIIVVCGNVDSSLARNAVEATLGAWRANGAGSAQVQPRPDLSAPVRRAVPMPHKSQADIVIAYPGLRRSDPEFYTLSQANVILGRLGLMGRLGDHVRDRLGLAYYCYSAVEDRRGDGLWLLRAGVNPANVDKAIAAMQDEVARLASEQVAEDEIQDAQQLLVGAMALRLETTEGLADMAHYMEYHSLGLDYLERYPGLVKSVTREKILEGAARHLDARQCATAVAGPVQG
jgi:zinc protease